MYPLEWLILKRLTIPSASEGVEKLELFYIAVGNLNWYKHIGRLFSTVN